MTTAILSVKNLSCSISGRSILDEISFDVALSETIGIVGPNGSGKTTLFNALSGFVPSCKGSILYNGTELINMPAYRRSRLGVGRLFQNFGIFRVLTVEENVLLALERGLSFSSFWRRAAKRNKEQARDYLDMVGLASKSQESAASLSGGQLRLLELVRTIAYGAKLILLDEPTAGVAPKMKSEILNAILKLKALGKTILIVEHDLSFIEAFSDRVLVLDQGRVVIDLPPALLRKSPQFLDLYYGQPTASQQP